MNRETMTLRRLLPAAALLGANVLSACGADAQPATRVIQPTKPDAIDCTSVQFIHEGSDTSYVTVQTKDGDGSKLDPDTILVTALNGEFNKTLDYADGKAYVRLPRSAVGLSVVALKGESASRCGTITYPYRSSN